MGNRNKMKSIKISKVKIIVLCFLGILIIATIVLGLSMAYIKPVSNPEETNISLKTCAKVSFKENSESINLENTYPIDEEMVLEKIKPYEFSITSTCDEGITYSLYLGILTSNSIEKENIRYGIKLKKADTFVEEGNLGELDNIETSFNNEEKREITSTIGETKEIIKIMEASVKKDEEKEYELYLWVDAEASNITMGKTFQGGVFVKGTEEYDPEKEQHLTIAEYIKSLYTKDGENNLYYHDGTGEYENASLEAGDNSYRYAGGNTVVHNYICLDGTTTEGLCASEKDLYRIIGLFKNDNGKYDVKLIKADYTTNEETGGEKIGDYDNYYSISDWYYNNYYKGSLEITEIAKYFWNNNTATKNWSESNLNNINLNQYFYNYLLKKNSNLEKLIQNHKWIVGGNTWQKIYGDRYEQNAKSAYENEILNPSENLIETKPIGLMYISDYYYSASPKHWPKKGVDGGNVAKENNYRSAVEDNWMYLGLYEWSITPSSSVASAFTIYPAGGVSMMYRYYNVNSDNPQAVVVRPVFYLNSSTLLYSGNGTKEEPYRL